MGTGWWFRSRAHVLHTHRFWDWIPCVIWRWWGQVKHLCFLWAVLYSQSGAEFQWADPSFAKCRAMEVTRPNRSFRIHILGSTFPGKIYAFTMLEVLGSYSVWHSSGAVLWCLYLSLVIYQIFNLVYHVEQHILPYMRSWVWIPAPHL